MSIQQIITRSSMCLLGLLGLTLFASPLAAQVFDSGPSDSALFDNVINVPTDRNIGFNATIGGDDMATVQLNISDGGSVGDDFSAKSGSEVNISGGSVGEDFGISEGELNISGGTIGDGFNPSRGSVVNITGGSVGGGLWVSFGAEINISGGVLGAGFRPQDDGNLELIGGEFELDGEPFLGSTISLNEGDVFTGTLADGSAFIFSQQGFLSRSDRFTDAQLTAVTLPPLDLSPRVVSTSNPNHPSGLRSGQTLTLLDGGQLGDHFEAINATLNVEGGIIGDSAGATNSTVNIDGGVVGDGFNAYTGSKVNISGGEVGVLLVAFPGSEVNISGGSVGNALYSRDSVVNITGGSVGAYAEVASGGVVNISGGSVGDHFDAYEGVVNITGGTIGDTFDVYHGSEVNFSGGSVGRNFRTSGVVNISGGTIDTGFTANDRAEVRISGGVFGSPFEARLGSDVELIGGEFRLNGTAFSGDTVSLAANDILSGTLTDGSTFVFSEQNDEELRNVTLTLAALPTLNQSPVAVSTAFPPIPSGLRQGQTLTLENGGELGTNFETVDATMNIHGGSLGHSASAVRSAVNIISGSVGESFKAYSGSVVEIRGGSVGAYFDAFDGSEVNIRGGSFEPGYYGANGFDAFEGSVVNLFGSNFVLNGDSLDDSLIVNQAFTIDDRDVALSGLLADGTAFRFYLNSQFSYLRDSFDPNSTVTVTLVSPVLLGDASQDGVVNFLDINWFIEVLVSGNYLEQADCNEDGLLNFLDIAFFIAILANI